MTQDSEMNLKFLCRQNNTAQFYPLSYGLNLFLVSISSLCSVSDNSTIWNYYLNDKNLVA